MKPGDLISHYQIVGLLGTGGMGEVYKAEDTRLKRQVALKVLTPALGDQTEAKQRLMVEAQAASALDHPNICTIYEIDETADGRVFLVMAYYEGETLAQRLARGVVPVGEAIEILTQLTRAVAAAHGAGMIHRDIKPANIFLTSRSIGDPSRVKLLDFGIARIENQTGLTRTGSTVGTLAYMAPEHIAGHAIDHRADIWSIGVVGYELLAGRRPFDGTNAMAIMKAIVDEQPAPITLLRPDAPPALEALAQRALAKRADERYASAHEFLAGLEALRPSLATATMVRPATPRRMGRWVTAGVAMAVVVAAAAWLFTQRVRANEITQSVTDFRALVESEKYSAAFRKLHTFRPELANDPAVRTAARDLLLPLHVTTDPPGADVLVKGYDEPAADWIALGPAPLDTRGGAAGAYRWRISKAGYATFEGSGPPAVAGDVNFKLLPEGGVPPGMVWVPGIALPNGAGRLPDFFIDRYEVTNQGFKEFVDAGGYRNPSYWPTTLSNSGKTLTSQELVAEFRDTTGRPGPATWELGTYPDGQADFPVAGISWYEAAAYARFKGRSLPTVHHWRSAAVQSIHSQILEWSNFSGKGPVRVGSLASLGSYGTYDMAGNVKEWCENGIDSKRYILGGGWNEPNYQYRGGDARSPFDRASNFGVRLIATPDPAAVPRAAHDPVTTLYRDYDKEKPVNDELFAAFRRSFAYDASDLAGKTESSSDTDAWHVERVSYSAAYGSERIPAYLFLPKNAKPPFQTVVYFPHSGGLVLDSFQQAEMAYLGFLVKSGRALLFPMYSGMYERRSRTPLSGPNAFRENVIRQIQDVSRSVDYLHSRSDIAHDQLAYFGVSLGASRASLALAVDQRFKTAILWSGGLPTSANPPEVDPLNFAPRVTTPVLMLNGRDDFTFPVATSQEPLFRLLGTPAADKGRGLYDGGHVFPFSRMIKDSLDWLDRYLGVPK